jgi:hypothetical protein
MELTCFEIQTASLYNHFWGAPLGCILTSYEFTYEHDRNEAL